MLNMRKNRNLIYWAGLVILTLLLTVITSCWIPLSDNQNKSKGNTVTFAIPHISGVIQEVFQRQNTTVSLPPTSKGADLKAFLVADRVDFTVYWYNPLNGDWVFNSSWTDYPGAFIQDPGDGVTASQKSFPAGDYWVMVDVYNNAFSTDTPPVSGEKGFTVVEGSNPPVVITCIPNIFYSDQVLNEGVLSSTQSLNSQWVLSEEGGAPETPGDERWFQAVPSSEYTQFELIPNASGTNLEAVMLIYDSQGEFLAANGHFQADSAGTPVTLELPTIPGEVYYIGIVDFSSVGGQQFNFRYQPYTQPDPVTVYLTYSGSDTFDSFSPIIILLWNPDLEEADWINVGGEGEYVIYPSTSWENGYYLMFNHDLNNNWDSLYDFDDPYGGYEVSISGNFSPYYQNGLSKVYQGDSVAVDFYIPPAVDEGDMTIIIQSKDNPLYTLPLGGKK